MTGGNFFARTDVEVPGPARDLAGYGEFPPKIRWAGTCKVAVQIILNYEEGSEKTRAMGDDETDFMYEPPVRVLEQRDLSVESMYEYGSRAGVWRLFRIFDQAGIPVTVFAAAVALERNPAVAAKIVQRHDEVAGHGFRWSNHWEMTRDEERLAIERAVASIEATIGQRPRGWFCREMSVNTRELLVEEGGFTYDSDCFNDDLPYWTIVSGKSHLVVPYTLVLNDGRFLYSQGFGSPTDFYDLAKATLDRLRDDGDEAGRMMSIGLHPRAIGYPGRADALARFINYAQGFDDVCFLTRLEIAEEFRREVPPPR